jgi:hypothetical protein
MLLFMTSYAQPLFADSICYRLFENEMSLNASSGSGIGPMKVEINERELNQSYRSDDTHFSSARDFATRYGRAFAELVRSRIDPNSETTILIAMGGAEHLGTLLELAFRDLLPNAKVTFKYVNLSTKVVKPWVASRQDSNGQRINRVGIGEPPLGYEMRSPNESNPRELARILNSEGVFDKPNLIVVDTGFQGSVVEAVGYIARRKSQPVHVEGVLLKMNDRLESTVPTFALNKSPAYSASPDFQKDLLHWATAIDENNSDGSQVSKLNDAFQRSSAVKDAKTRSNYLSTLAGLRAGLTHSVPPLKPSGGGLAAMQPSELAPLVKPNGKLDMPEQYDQAFDPRLSANERRQILLQLNLKMKERLDGRPIDAQRAWVDQMIASLDKNSPRFGLQLVIANLPAVKEVLARVTGRSLAGETKLELRDLLLLHSSMADLPIEQPGDRAVEALRAFVVSTLHPATQATSLLELSQNKSQIARYLAINRVFRPSLEKPIRLEAHESPASLENLVAGLKRRENPLEFWRRLGLGSQFRSRFPTDADFWSSEKSFIEVYNELRSMQPTQ